MKRKLTAIIVDDDPAAIALLEEYGERMESVMMMGKYTDPREALAYLRNHYVDVVLLDVEMPDINGFEFLAQMPSMIGAILCTGFEQSAQEVFDYEVYDYLAKPIGFKRFAKAIARAEVLVGLGDPNTDTTGGEYYYFFVRNKEGRGMYMKINFEELIFIETTYELTKFCLLGMEEFIESRANIKKIQDVLPADKFYQIHRNFIINIDYLKKVQGGMAYLRGTDECIPIGNRNRYPRFSEWIAKNLIDSN